MVSPNAVKPLKLAENPRLMVMGEAPGPDGANLSGSPFIGDPAGLLIFESVMESYARPRAADYRELEGLWRKWRRLVYRRESEAAERKKTAREIVSFLKGKELPVLMTNAFDRMPIDPKGVKRFRSPTRKEIFDPSNVERVRGELRTVSNIWCVGRAAESVAKAALGADWETPSFSAEPLQIHRVDGKTVVVTPHTSGRNYRFWTPKLKERLVRTLAKLH